MKGGPMVLLGVTLGIGGLIFGVVRGSAVGFALCAVGLVIEFAGPYIHDKAHRRQGEEPHAMWGKGDRNKPDWLRR